MMEQAFVYIAIIEIDNRFGDSASWTRKPRKHFKRA